MGAKVIITTRYPHDAAKRFSQEPDYKTFDLHIYGIDFRDISMVHQFCRHLKHNFKQLDVHLINLGFN